MTTQVKRQRLRKQADTLFSALVRSRGYCEACGSTEGLQCAHIVSRSYLATRWDRDNATCLCLRCHLRYTHRPLEWEQWVTEQFGEDHYRNLKTRALKGGRPDYDAILERLKR